MKAVKNLGGRPTKLTAALMNRADDYIVNYADYGDLIPSIAGLADHLGVSRSTVHLWGSDNRRFSDILEALMARQERALITGGLRGGKEGYNPLIAKLILTKHGYSDRQDVAVNANVAVAEMTEDALNRRIAELTTTAFTGSSGDADDSHNDDGSNQSA